MHRLSDRKMKGLTVIHNFYLKRPDGTTAAERFFEILEKEGFKAVWDNSDIQRILTNLAETSVNRYRHLETNPEKTKSKIKQSQKQNQR
jgi:hypothetical protein